MRIKVVLQPVTYLHSFSRIVFIWVYELASLYVMVLG